MNIKSCRHKDLCEVKKTYYKIILLIFLVYIFLFPSTLLAWTGKVVSVTDGDTAKIIRLDTGRQIKVRFAGIDSPEKEMAYGQAAKKFVGKLIGGKIVEVQHVTFDRYGRTVGYIRLDGREINFEIVEAGYTWVNRKYMPKPKKRADRYMRAEALARKSRIGLWQDPNPIPPWEWRKAQRLKRKKNKKR